LYDEYGGMPIALANVARRKLWSSWQLVGLGRGGLSTPKGVSKVRKLVDAEHRSVLNGVAGAGGTESTTRRS
jgi:hypothetical protein